METSPGETDPTSGADRSALVALYNATNGAGWLDNDNWLTGTPLEEWHGVTVDADDRVSRLELEGNLLHGQLPPELGILTELSVLKLSCNELKGPIPVELANLSNLVVLDLGHNQLTGEYRLDWATSPVSGN